MKKLYSLLITTIIACHGLIAQSWSPVGTGMSNLVEVLGVYNGELYAGGFFTTAGGFPANHIAKWNGVSWSPVGSGMDSDVTSLVVYNGELYAGGFFSTAGGVPANFLAKWNSTNWSAVGDFGGVYDGDVNALAVYNGELYVGGWAIGANSVSTNSIAKWNGTSWSALGSGINDGIFSLAVYNGELYAGGNFTIASGDPANYIAKWNGTSWSAVGTGMNERVFALTVYNGELYAGGYFTTAGGIPVNHIAKWNGSSWAPVSSGIAGGIYNVGVFELNVYDGELYCGGNFLTAGGTTAYSIAKWNGISWSSVGTGMGGTSIPSQVHALSVYNGALYTGGYFTTAGGIPANYIAKWSICNFPTQPGPITGNTSVCSNSTQLYSISPVNGAISYTWTLPPGGGWTGSSTTNSITATAGNNSGNISVTANNGCGTSVAQSLAVDAIPVLSKPDTIMGNIFPCKGTTQTYSVLPVIGATNYTWTLPPNGGWTGSSTTNSIAATIGNNSGTISVTATNTCDFSVIKTLDVMVTNAPLQPGIISGNATVSVGQSFNYSVNSVSGATAYNWSLSGGGSITSGLNTTTVSIDWLTPGNYTLSVNARNNCGISSDRSFNITVSIKPGNPFEIKVMPNPSSGDIYLKAKGVANKKIGVEIINGLGQIIYRDQYVAGTNDFSQLFDLNKIAAGIYQFKIIIDDKIYLKPIVVIN